MTHPTRAHSSGDWYSSIDSPGFTVVRAASHAKVVRRSLGGGGPHSPGFPQHFWYGAKQLKSGAVAGLNRFTSNAIPLTTTAYGPRRAEQNERSTLPSAPGGMDAHTLLDTMPHDALTSGEARPVLESPGARGPGDIARSTCAWPSFHDTTIDRQSWLTFVPVLLTAYPGLETTVLMCVPLAPTDSRKMTGEKGEPGMSISISPVQSAFM